jgi:hypothetical protein
MCEGMRVEDRETENDNIKMIIGEVSYVVKLLELSHVRIQSNAWRLSCAVAYS